MMKQVFDVGPLAVVQPWQFFSASDLAFQQVEWYACTDQPETRQFCPAAPPRLALAWPVPLPSTHPAASRVRTCMRI